MIHIGTFNTLEILRETSVGLFLGDSEGNDILLPNKYVPEAYEIGAKISVFCYLDHEERPIATTLDPYIKLNEFALLRAAEVNQLGAFMDWGLEQHLFVPFREQARKMEAGKWYLVYMYMDPETQRLAASSKTHQFVSNENLTIQEGEEVEVIVARFTDIGMEVIINQKHLGLVYNDEVFSRVRLGEKRKGYIRKIRPDHKIDVSFQPQGLKNMEVSSVQVMEALQRNGGFLGLHDKSSSEDIAAILGMSKKSFKKAIGTLYKQKLIVLKEDGIYKV